MRTVSLILTEAGKLPPGFHFRIENPPWMTLSIEELAERGPLGFRAVSVAHYGEQNGDLMRDPEMCFELSRPFGFKSNLVPFYFRNDYMGVEQWSRSNDGKHYAFRPDLYAQHQEFAALWDKNLRAQGFVEAFERQH